MFKTIPVNSSLSVKNVFCNYITPKNVLMGVWEVSLDHIASDLAWAVVQAGNPTRLRKSYNLFQYIIIQSKEKNEIHLRNWTGSIGT